MTAILRGTILGSGYSAGVPRADGDWGVCDPSNPRNRRSRCSFLIQRIAADSAAAAATTVIVDTAPELRIQASTAGVRRLDAVLFSHDHADQTAGFDDVRAFFLSQRQRIACYADAPTRASLARRFDYAFAAKTSGYPPIAELHLLPPHGAAWRIGGPSGPIPVISYDQDHGQVRSAGFRFGDVAYSADVLSLPPEAMEALQGLDVFVVDALRDSPNPAHAHVARALEWIDALRPRRAILTNLHGALDYADLAARLPPNVEPAYDGLSFDSLLNEPDRG